MKKISSIILTIVLILSIVSPLAVYANTDTAQDSVPLLQEGEISASFSADYSISDTTLASVQEVIYDGLINVKSYFSISSYKVPVSDFLLIYSN
ncbi:hypothetical protein, partial [uncultured Eubacterium sp.]|uniref:hypothetical protein n=1 Tax=uncultured Eubacterium sp. TaxID=165185 RepID=UPI0015C101FB